METKIIQIAKWLNEKIELDIYFDIMGFPREHLYSNKIYQMTHCPLHKEQMTRSLEINKQYNTYRCTHHYCRGMRGGDLIDLYSITHNINYLDGIRFWAKQLNLLEQDLKSVL